MRIPIDLEMGQGLGKWSTRWPCTSLGWEEGQEYNATSGHVHSLFPLSNQARKVLALTHHEILSLPLPECRDFQGSLLAPALFLAVEKAQEFIGPFPTSLPILSQVIHSSQRGITARHYALITSITTDDDDTWI